MQTPWPQKDQPLSPLPWQSHKNALWRGFQSLPKTIERETFIILKKKIKLKTYIETVFNLWDRLI